MNRLLTLSLSLLLVGLVAGEAAADWSVRVSFGDRVQPRSYRPYFHRPAPHPVTVVPAPRPAHRPVPRPVVRPAPVERVWVPGYYRTVQTQVWVPGYTSYEWVPEEARYYRFRGRLVREVTRPGYYREVEMPGRYETREEQVWVPGYWEERPVVRPCPVIYSPPARGGHHRPGHRRY